MSPMVAAYGSLLLAILCEVSGSAFMQKSQQFTRLFPSVMTVLLYGTSFFMLSQALKALPLGVAYAVWAGLGIVLTALIGLFLFRQALDTPAVIGMSLIVAGVVVMQTFSKSVSH